VEIVPLQTWTDWMNAQTRAPMGELLRQHDSAGVAMAQQSRPDAHKRHQIQTLLLKHPLLQRVDSACLKGVMESAILRDVSPGEQLYSASDPAEYYWLACAGTARLYLGNEKNAERTTQLIVAPAAWGESLLMHGRPNSESCVAVDRLKVAALPKQVFLNLIKQSTSWSQTILADLSAKFLQATAYQQGTRALSVKARVAVLLSSYLRVFGVPAEGGHRIRVSISQATVAADLNIALRSVSRAFTDLVAKGLLRKVSGRYVCDWEGLRALFPSGVPGIDWGTSTGV
jgi:CRP-like cAMP-binding protein